MESARTQVHAVLDSKGNIVGFNKSVSQKAVWAKKSAAAKAQIVKKRVAPKKLGIKEEAAVIRYVSPDAYVLNDKLRRNADSELTDVEREWIKNLDAALEKLSNYEGNLNRSVAFLFEEDARKFFDEF